MDIQEYIDQKKDLYDHLLQFIDNENDTDQKFQQLINIIKSQNVQDNIPEFKLFINLLKNISDNHLRMPMFFNRLEKILTYYKNEIKQSYTNTQIYSLFKENRKTVQILIQNDILTLDVSVVDQMLKPEYQNRTFEYFYYYFYPEIKSFFNKNDLKLIINEMIKIDPKIFVNFHEKRDKGENESHICSLIREDSLDEFITYINETNIPLSSKVSFSIFETNTMLNRKRATLIEYAAFFGSIKILQYLKMNDIKLTPSLWEYSIHSNNPELIQFLEENEVDLDEFYPKKLYKIAIGCHHNEIAEYIYDNLLSEKDKIPIDLKALDNSYDLEFSYRNDIFSYGFKYCNYHFLPTDMNLQIYLYYACYFGFFEFVKYFVNNKDWDLNLQIILTLIFFEILFSI